MMQQLLELAHIALSLQPQTLMVEQSNLQMLQLMKPQSQKRSDISSHTRLLSWTKMELSPVKELAHGQFLIHGPIISGRMSAGKSQYMMDLFVQILSQFEESCFITLNQEILQRLICASSNMILHKLLAYLQKNFELMNLVVKEMLIAQ